LNGISGMTSLNVVKLVEICIYLHIEKVPTFRVSLVSAFSVTNFCACGITLHKSRTQLVYEARLYKHCKLDPKN
jgi:hypothetical protein